MLNWIINPRLDIRSKLRIAYDLLYVMIVYRVKEIAFLPVACGAMFRLNRYARQVSRHNAHSIYDLKHRFVRMLYEFGYCRSVTQQRQVLECWACAGTGVEYHDSWSGDMDACWKCGGSGIYRTVALYRFAFNVRGTRWIWHQPRGLVGWPVDVTCEDPGPCQRPGDVERRAKKEIGRAIVIVWAALRFARSPQPALPGLPRPDERYRHIPFPTEWFENQVPLTPWHWRTTRWIKRRIEQIKMRLLWRFWPAKFDELYSVSIPF